MSAIAFAVIMVVLAVAFFATMYVSSGGWIGVLWGVLSLVLAFLILGGLSLLAKRKRGLAAGMFLVGVMFVIVGFGSVGIMATGGAVQAASLSVLVGELALGVAGMALIVWSARIALTGQAGRSGSSRP